MGTRKVLGSYLALPVLTAGISVQVLGQLTYTPYAFTNFAGQPGGPGVADGAGQGARFHSPGGTAVDAGGNVFVVDQLNFTIRRITPAGLVTTIAGVPGQPGTNDGVGSLARFGSIYGGASGIAVDPATNVYVADTPNFTIRKLTPSGDTWTVTTLAGRPAWSGSVDGTGSTANFGGPAALAADAGGNVYVADKFAIRRVTPAGVVTTLAGSVMQAGATDGANGVARFGSAVLGPPKGVAIDSALNIFVADTYNNTIRRVTPVGADWVVSTYAGTAGGYGFNDGVNGTAQFANPFGITADGSGNVYVSDYAAQTLRKIVLNGTDRVVSTFAGAVAQTGSADGNGTAARFQVPEGMSADASGDLYVADFGNNTVRKITPDGLVTTLAGRFGGAGSADGIGSAAQFDIPHSAAVDGAGNVYVGDTFNHTIRKITPAGEVTTIAGSVHNKGYVDGVGTAEAPQFNSPIGVAADSAGNLYLADNGNQTIRKITSDGAVTTLAGQVGVKGSADGPALGATFNSPNSTAVDSKGNVFVSDLVNRTIRKIAANGDVTTFAGQTGSQGTNDGVGNTARFTAPMGLAVDQADNLYVADQGGHTIRKIASDGTVVTLAGRGKASGTNDGVGSLARFASPEAVAVDSDGNVYVCDTANQTIRKITADGAVTTLAGVAKQKGSTDGTNDVALFDTPRGIVVDAAGTIYVADSVNCTIRKLVVAGADCVVTTLAGDANGSGSVDGTGDAARFQFPYRLALDQAGNIYAADRSNCDIRKITPEGVVTTFAGVPGWAGSIDGRGAAAQFYGPEELTVDDAGNIYVIEHFNNTVRRIAPNGTNWVVTTLAGCASCAAGTNDGTGVLARFNGPFGLTHDSAGNLYVADTGNRTIRKLTSSGQEWTVTTFAGGGQFQGGSLDGKGTNAHFAAPLGLAADAGGIYVADSSMIRKITLDGVVTTLAGCSACGPGAVDGVGAAALFWGARGVAVDAAGSVYVADSANHLVRRLTLNGGQWTVTTLGGSPGAASGADGVGSDARFNQPTGVAVDGQGNLYVVNSQENSVVKGTPAGATTRVSFDTSSGSLLVAGGSLQMRITGASTGSIVLERSVDFTSWDPISTNPVVGGSLNLSAPVGGFPYQFFRGRVLP